MTRPAQRPKHRALLTGALFSLAALTAACSRSDVPEHAVMLPSEDLPDAVLGYARWEADAEPKPIRRVSCELQDGFYVMTAEGRDFVLRVGFWGQDAREIGEIDFDQADSVELRAVDDDLYFYRYTTLRILSEMGPVSGSADSVQGRTPLRATSAEAVAKHRAGVEVDFEFSCSQSGSARVAGS